MLRHRATWGTTEVPSVFICHASEDKDTIARPLAAALRDRHVEVWYDEFSLKVGDSLRAKIDEGLSQSDFGVVIVSPAFFTKRWTQRELGGLVAREMAGTRTIVLPVWHNIDRDEILLQSPPLADVVAVNSNAGLTAVVDRLLQTIRRSESPLVIARQRLQDMAVSTPSTADDWWLDITELKQWLFAFPDCTQRWIFPLPFQTERTSYERGMNLTSTALQLDWCYEAEERGLCQLTHPEILHAFLRAKPGMVETARQSPGTLAMYAPQLTLPEYDDGLADVFEALLDPERKDGFEMPGYGGWETVDGKAPACGELIAWRHSIFGGLTNRHLAYSFVNSHDGSYSRRSHSTFVCLAWLLSDESSWLPARIAGPLEDGFRSRGLWFSDLDDMDNPLVAALYKHGRKGFRLTRAVRRATEDLLDTAVGRLGLTTPATTIADRFIERGFIDGWYAEQEAIRVARSRRAR
jgi:TIR domain